VYADNPPAPDELQFDFVAFRQHTADLAQLIADRDDHVTYGIIADGAIQLYFDTGAAPYPVRQAIYSKDTDAPGWNQYDNMNDKDRADVADAWLNYRRYLDDPERHTHLDDDDPYEPPKKLAKPEIFRLEVSMLEADDAFTHPFMTLRSRKRKYAPMPTPMGTPGGPMVDLNYGLDELFAANEPVPFQPAPPVDAPLLDPVMPPDPGPPPDTTHVDPKHVAVRLDDNGLPGPSASHGAYYRATPDGAYFHRFRTNFQTNREGVWNDDEDPEPEAELYYNSDAGSEPPYEDQ